MFWTFVAEVGGQMPEEILKVSSMVHFLWLEDTPPLTINRHNQDDTILFHLRFKTVSILSQNEVNF